MTITFSAGDETPEALLQASEEFYRNIAIDLALAVQKLSAGELGEVKAAMQAVKDMRAMFQIMMDERTRVEKLRKQVAGVVEGAGYGQSGLDFDAARDEIGRRLACLRDAGGGG